MAKIIIAIIIIKELVFDSVVLCSSSLNTTCFEETVTHPQVTDEVNRQSKSPAKQASKGQTRCHQLFQAKLGGSALSYEGA